MVAFCRRVAPTNRVIRSSSALSKLLRAEVSRATEYPARLGATESVRPSLRAKSGGICLTAGSTAVGLTSRAAVFTSHLHYAAPRGPHRTTDLLRHLRPA